MAKKPSKALQVLAENLDRLMQVTPEFGTQPKVAAKAKIDQKTVWRITKKLNEPSTDKVERIAAVFGLEAWQLLVPDLQPSHPPELADQVVTN